MNSRLTILGVVTAVLVIGGLVLLAAGNPAGDQSHTGASSESTGSGGSQAVPDLTLQNFSGEDVALSSFTGTPLVLNAWATWCPFCVNELPAFVTVQQEFGDEVTIVAIDRAETRAVAQQYIDEVGLGADLTFLLDPSDSFYQAIGGFSMPETLFVAADGTIRFHKRGPMDAAEIRQRVQELVGS